MATVSVQILSKVLETKDYSILENNLLTKDYFVGYTDEFDFIENHYKTYGQVPDKATFFDKFDKFPFVEVEESDEYLVDTIREENLYYRLAPVVNKVAELTKDDSNAAVAYMVEAIKNLQPNYKLKGKDIIETALERYDEYKERVANQNNWYFTTGFKELDDEIHGFKRKEELIVLVARINQGKSWISERITEHIHGLGFNVGYISPEMSASDVGYRFDTLRNHISNGALMWGDNVNEDDYKEYLSKLKENKNKFIVATPIDFNNVITVSKLKQWIKQNDLQFVAIDGIKYLTDERSRKVDNTTTRLTNISEDLMSLSMELEVPILVVIQANRGGVKEVGDNSAPNLEDIRDSDGPAQNASKVISIRQLDNNILRIDVKKNRHGKVGSTIRYSWDIDKGTFQFLPQVEDEDDISSQKDSFVPNKPADDDLF